MISRRDILLSMLNKEAVEKVPVTTCGVDRFSHPWMAGVEVAGIVGKDVILIGNIQLDDIERASAERIDALVKEAVEEVGDKAPFIVAPTAHPIEIPLPSNAARNIIQLLKSAWKYGQG